jgi:CRP/FNR family transcriptional regulator
MNLQEEIIREKLNDCYSNVFEEDLVAEIAKEGLVDKINEGHLMIDIGQEMTHLPLILNGIIKIIRKDKQGDEIVLYFLERGDTCAISFVNCINRKKSIFKGIVEKDAEVILLPVNKMDEWLSNFKSWRAYIIDSYHFRLLEMVESIDCLAFMKLDQRLLKYLADKVKITKNDDLEITHQEIANDLNSSRVVITRLLKKLHNDGKIYSSRNRIRVLEY